MFKNIFLVVGFALSMGCATTGSSGDLEAGTTAAEGCHTPLGFIAEGRTATGYLHQIESRGQSCQQGTLRCEDGVWSGGYIYPSCVVTP